MELEELEAEIDYLFHPEPDEDGQFPREIPEFAPEKNIWIGF